LFRLRYIAYIYLLILLIGTLVPLGQLNHTLNDNYTLNIRWDYLIHALVYMPMTVLLGFGLMRGRIDNDLQAFGSVRYWIIIAFAGLFIAASLEALQLIIPYRRFNINDMLANGLGVLIGLIIIPVFRRFLSRVS